MRSEYRYEEGIVTQRLVTRWLSEEDVKVWTGFLSDPECTRYFPNAQFSSQADRAEFWINKQLDRYQERRYGLQALIDRVSGEFVGQCGLLLQEVDGKQELEVGYHLFRKFWGAGFASEAAAAYMNYASTYNLAESIISIIHRDNLPSQAVAKRNGLLKEKETTWFDLPVLIFRKSLLVQS